LCTGLADEGSRGGTQHRLTDHRPGKRLRFCDRRWRRCGLGLRGRSRLCRRHTWRWTRVLIRSRNRARAQQNRQHDQ
jgi:hypothetical protein